MKWPFMGIRHPYVQLAINLPKEQPAFLQSPQVEPAARPAQWWISWLKVANCRRADMWPWFYHDAHGKPWFCNPNTRMYRCVCACDIFRQSSKTNSMWTYNPQSFNFHQPLDSRLQCFYAPLSECDFLLSKILLNIPLKHTSNHQKCC